MQVLSTDVTDDWLEASGWFDCQTKLNCFPQLQVRLVWLCGWQWCGAYMWRHAATPGAGRAGHGCCTWRSVCLPAALPASCLGMTAHVQALRPRPRLPAPWHAACGPPAALQALFLHDRSTINQSVNRSAGDGETLGVLKELLAEHFKVSSLLGEALRLALPDPAAPPSPALQPQVRQASFHSQPSRCD